MHLPRQTIPRTIGLVLTIGAILGTAAAAPTAVDGWRGYKFGMTPDQVRAVAGMKWGQLSSVVVFGTTSSSMSGSEPVAQYGHKFEIALIFDSSPVLVEIDLTSREARGSAAQCRRSYETLLGAFEKSYGTFRPVNTPQDTNGNTSGGKSVTWQRLPGASSQYEFDKSFVGKSAFYSSDAAVSSGGASLDVKMTSGDGSAGPGCSLGVTYKRA